MVPPSLEACQNMDEFNSFVKNLQPVNNSRIFFSRKLVQLDSSGKSIHEYDLNAVVKKMNAIYTAHKKEDTPDKVINALKLIVEKEEAPEFKPINQARGFNPRRIGQLIGNLIFRLFNFNRDDKIKSISSEADLEFAKMTITDEIKENFLKFAENLATQKDDRFSKTKEVIIEKLLKVAEDHEVQNQVKQLIRKYDLSDNAKAKFSEKYANILADPDSKPEEVKAALQVLNCIEPSLLKVKLSLKGMRMGHLSYYCCQIKSLQSLEFFFNDKQMSPANTWRKSHFDEARDSYPKVENSLRNLFKDKLTILDIYDKDSCPASTLRENLAALENAKKAPNVKLKEGLVTNDEFIKQITDTSFNPGDWIEPQI